MTTRCECSIFLLCTKRSLNEIGLEAETPGGEAQLGNAMLWFVTGHVALGMHLHPEDDHAAKGEGSEMPLPQALCACWRSVHASTPSNRTHQKLPLLPWAHLDS